MMGATAVVAMLVVMLVAVTVYGGNEERGIFMMEKSETVVKTESGEVRVVTGPYSYPRPLLIAFITMEPSTLFIPHFIDESLLLFVKTGDARIGWIYRDEMVEKQLKKGDVNRIPAGSAFYMVNTGKGQRLKIICAIVKSEGSSFYQSFFLGGGMYPKAVLAGFDVGVLTTAFNATSEEINSILISPVWGPIIPFPGEDGGNPEKLALSKLKATHKKTMACHEDLGTWTWRKLLTSVIGGRDNGWKGKNGGPVHAPESYNLYDREPDFRNKHGSTMALDEDDYEPLRKEDIGIFFVSLTAGSMLAPHLNPTAMEIGVVHRGSGTVQVVFPNGTLAMSTEVKEGDVYWIPRYFPFCQVAGRGGPMELFGFTTSARPNRPQFLAGASSVLKKLMGPELAAGFGVGEKALAKFLDSQAKDTIFPPSPLPWEQEMSTKKREAI